MEPRIQLKIQETRRNSHNRPARYVNGLRLSDTTQSEKKIKIKVKMKILESRSSCALSPACSTPKKLWKSAAAPQSRTCRWVDIHEQRDGWTLKNNVMGCQADICVERILQRIVAIGKSVSAEAEDIEYHHP